LGGETREREVSLTSGAAFGAALRRRGHSVLFLDPATGMEKWLRAAEGPAEVDVPTLAAEFGRASPDRTRLLESLIKIPRAEIDAVAILLHGGAGEGGMIQAVLELLDLPYTGSGPLPSALAMDKVRAKGVLKSEGIPVAEELLWRVPEVPAAGSASPPAPVPAPPGAGEIAALGGYPVVVKPIAGGSTVGVTIVHSEKDWREAHLAAEGQIDPDRGLLVERYIPGRELTVGLLEDRALPVVEIVPKTGFYDYRRKYTKGETEYVVPAQIPEWTARELQSWAERAYRVLGCRDMARVDFRLAPDGRAACLEVNTIPGMTAVSLLPMAAAAIGMGFDELAQTLCLRARRRRSGRPEQGAVG